MHLLVAHHSSYILRILLIEALHKAIDALLANRGQLRNTLHEKEVLSK